jgi:hypothetical protein
LARERFGAALRRVQAQEDGNRRVARLRPRPLLEHAANDRPPAARRKAALAALAVRIEQGATPALAGWQSLPVGGGGVAWGLPTAVIGALGLVVAAAIAGGRPPEPQPRSIEASKREHGSRGTDDRSPPMRSPMAASVAEDSIVRAESTISGSFVPNGRSGSTIDPANVLQGRSETTIEHSTEPIVRAESTIGSPGSAKAPSKAPIADVGTSDARIDASKGSADASTLAAETRLLEQAREALRRDDVDAALAALDTHQAEFPQGSLLDEARSTRLRALCAAGRSDEATALADRLAPGQQAFVAEGDGHEGPPRKASRWHDVVAASCR